MKANIKKALAKVVAALESERDDLDSQVIQELQEAFDDLSEKAQEGEKGEALQGEIDVAQEGYDALDNLISDLNGLLEQ